MANTQIPTVRTTPTLTQFARALLAVWPEATKEGAGILWSHFAGETGSGVHCYGWNLGNVKWTPGCGYDYMALAGNVEYVDGKPVTTAKSNPASWFRAYPSLEAGMRSFVTFKRDPSSRYATAWPMVVAGDPEGYASELRKHGYYTAPLELYQKSMRRFFDAWMASTAWDDVAGEPAPDAPVDFAIVHAMPDPVAPDDPTVEPGYAHLDYDPDAPGRG